MRSIAKGRIALAAASVAALTVSLLSTASPVSSAPAAPAPAAAPAAERGSDPWTDPSYEPRRGHWRDYVLAPDDRLVRPTEVENVRVRGGSVDGDPATLLTQDDDTIRITSSGRRADSPLVILDLGKEVSGPAQVRVTAASGERPELHVCYSESLQYLAQRGGQNDGQTAHAPGCDTANIWNGFPGVPYTADTDSHTLPLADAELPALLEDPELRGGYRYLTLFLDGPGWVEVDDVAMRFTAAQGQEDLDDYRGHFLSSDHLLNKIWYAGAYTVQINTDRPDTAKQWPYAAGEGDHADDVVPGADPDTDVIFDGGKRDRIVWQGDLAVQDPVTYVSTYDLPAVENSLSSLAGQQLDDGYMPAASQVGPHNAGELRVYGEYVTWFVSNMAEHYRWTGDLAYLQRWWPAMQRAVDWLEAQRDDTGLLSMAASGSCGHYGYRNCGHETYNNALYARILDQMAGLAADAGSPEARTTYADRAEAVRAAVNDQLWDEQVGAYRLSTEIPTAFPQDGNAAAVLAGIASPTQAKRAMRYLQRNNWTDIGALTVSQSTPNASLPPFHAPLPSWFEVDARLAAPGASVLEQQSAFELMHRFWGWMLRQDPGSTFWEHVLPGGDPNLAQFSSLAHGWAAGPTVSMTTKVLGVSPTEPGFRRFEVRPHPGSLSWAEGTVPTPHGDVRAAWQRTGRDFRLDASVPSGTVADLAVPAESQRVRVTLDGRVVWDGKSGPARPQDGYATVAGVGPGNHVVRVLPLDEPATEVSALLSPSSTVAEPGDLQAFDVTVTGRAPNRIKGTIEVVTPEGWLASEQVIPVDLASNGRPVSESYRFFVRVPEDAGSGTFVIEARLSAAGQSDVDRSTVRLSRTETISDFESGTQGWQAGTNVASVAAVGSFANGPGRPFAGNGALEATATAAPANAERVVYVEPEQPLDLAEAQSVLVRVDGYGGAPGASGYQGVVRLTGAGGDVLEKAFAISPDAWNTLELDTAAWAGRSSVTRIEVSFAAIGSATEWLPRFQVDGVEWVG